MHDEKLSEELANWIEQRAIAEAIMRQMQEAGIEPTLNNTQKLWLTFLSMGLQSGLAAAASVMKNNP